MCHISCCLLHCCAQGNLPNEWGTCGWPNTCMSGLKNLTCAACGLSGPLPPGWQWMSLHTLVLPRNRISGGLPDSWVQLPGLSYVDLSFNQLTAVPHNSYFSTVNIQVAYLQGNALNGSLPIGEALACRAAVDNAAAATLHALLPHPTCAAPGPVQAGSTRAWSGSTCPKTSSQGRCPAGRWARAQACCSGSAWHTTSCLVSSPTVRGLMGRLPRQLALAATCMCAC